MEPQVMKHYWFLIHPFCLSVFEQDFFFSIFVRFTLVVREESIRFLYIMKMAVYQCTL